MCGTYGQGFYNAPRSEVWAATLCPHRGCQCSGPADVVSLLIPMNTSLPSSSAAAAAPRELCVQALQLSLGDWQLCQHWSHAWEPGLHLLCGGDGAGKSSLLRALAGMQALQAGCVCWSDAAITSPDVFWVDPRQPQLQAAEGSTPQQWAAQQAQRYSRWNAAQWQSHLEHWQLQPEVSKPWHALSTGTARKLWMAAALASGAALVLIDEPVAGLDRPSVAYVRTALAAHTAASQAAAQWVMVAHYDDLQGLPWDSVVELEALPQ